jgi:glutathione synthase/RimK-type ligase-like ATP-grasp enzyme
VSSVVILEIEDNSDKSRDKNGIRVDSLSIISGLKECDIKAKVVFYKNKKREELLKEFVKDKISALLIRINPKDIKKVDNFFDFLTLLEQNGIKVYSSPNTMLKIHFKDVLIHFRDKEFCTKDVSMYNSYKEFKEKFPLSLMKHRVRILKKNFSSDGDGIWLVRTQENGTITATEAIDGKKIVYLSIDSFLSDFKSKFDYKDKNATYIKDKLGVIDMKYLSKVLEGEYRVLLVKDEIKHIIHKKPKKDNFCVSYYSDYIYEEKNNEKKEIEKISKTVKKSLKDIKEYINELPILWSIDFIKSKDKYLLSEINPSCVDISSVLDISTDIAQAIQKDIGAKK